MHKSYVSINGVRHGLVIMPAHSPSAPAVLFAHGGPGSPILPLAHARNLDFRDSVTLCFWDQRGAGMSARGVDDESLTLDQLVADTVSITEHVLLTLGKSRATMLGHSWGTYLGACAVATRPELYSAYIGVGQVNSLAAADEARLTFFRAEAEKRNDTETVAALSAFAGRNLSSDRQWASMQEKQADLTGTGFLRSGYSRKQLLRDTFRCTPYSLRERASTLPGMFRSYKLYSEIYSQPLIDRVPELEVPVHIAAGAHDFITPAGQARAIYDGVIAPSKSWTDFTESAHAPFIEEPSRFETFLRDALAV